MSERLRLFVAACVGAALTVAVGHGPFNVARAQTLRTAQCKGSVGQKGLTEFMNEQLAAGRTDFVSYQSAPGIANFLICAW